MAKCYNAPGNAHAKATFNILKGWILFKRSLYGYLLPHVVTVPGKKKGHIVERFIAKNLQVVNDEAKR